MLEPASDNTSCTQSRTCLRAQGEPSRDMIGRSRRQLLVTVGLNSAKLDKLQQRKRISNSLRCSHRCARSHERRGSFALQTACASIAAPCLHTSGCVVCSSTTPHRKSSNRVLSPRPISESSPSASTSKGFLHSGTRVTSTRVTSTREKYKQRISRI